MTTLLSPFADQKQGTMVVASAFGLLLLSTIFVAARAIVRYRMSNNIESADFLLPIALLFAVTQTICVRIQVSYGLGQHWTTLDDPTLGIYLKFKYTSNIISALVLFLTKTAIVLLIKSVEPQYPILMGCNLLLGVIATYTVSAVAGLAFQCRLPKPWLLEPGRCINIAAFSNAIIAMNIVTDLVIVVLPIVMMYRVRTSRVKKIFVCSLFGTRIIVPLVTIPQVYYLQSALRFPSASSNLVDLQIWTQVVMNLSIVTACIPSLGRWMWEFGSTLTSPRLSAHAEHGTPKKDIDDQSMVQYDSEDGDVKVRDLSIQGSAFIEYGGLVQVPKKTYPMITPHQQ